MANKVIIIGGGASGIMSAITAARHGARVTLIEHKNRIGKKILATGNGRCNISNRFMDKKYFHSDSKNIFEPIFTQFDLQATIDFFREIGVEILELEEGKLYPYSLQAASVVNVMLDELAGLNVQVECDTTVNKLEVENRVIVHTNKKKFYGDKLILATGGRSTPNLGSDGSGYGLLKFVNHKKPDVYPSLVQLVSDYVYLKHLKGTKVMANLDLIVDDNVLRSEYGELLFTDYGLSGPPILQLSRLASKTLVSGNQNVFVVCDLLPNIEATDLDDLLLRRIEHMPQKNVERFFVGLLPKQLIVPLLKENQISLDETAANITRNQREAVVKWLKHLKIKITDTNTWQQSQVTAGGVDCRSVDEQTLALKNLPNVYLCGEILDMDGDCGGFNLQWAWSSGYVAGYNAATQ